MRFASFLLAAVTSAAVIPTSSRSAEMQSIHHFQHSITRTLGYKYLLARPAGYETVSGKTWPLLLFLHGSGERGDDVWAVAKHGPPKLLRADTPAPADESSSDHAQRTAARNALVENFIVVSPQCPKNTWWDTTALLALLDEVSKNEKVDPSRVYLAGLSMGGYGVWELGLAHPERFAAVIPVCGGGSFGTLFQSHTLKRQELRTLAVWAFHGAKDETVPVTESERMVERLQALKVREAKLTVYPDARHDSWTATFANPEIYQWLLRHERILSSESAAVGGRE